MIARASTVSPFTFEPSGPKQTRAPGHGALAQLLAHRFRPLHETVAHPAHAGQDGRNVGAQHLGAPDPELVKASAPVEGVRCLDQRLRGHAADRGAGRSPVAVIHQQEIVGVASHLAQGG